MLPGMHLLAESCGLADCYEAAIDCVLKSLEGWTGRGLIMRRLGKGLRRTN